MNKILWPIFLSFWLLLIFGCSTIRTPQPLEAGEHQFGLSLGGPLFDNLGMPIPLPMVSADYQYGLTDDVTLGGAVHVTPLLFNLFFMAELDAAYGVLDQQGAIPGVTLFTHQFFQINSEAQFMYLPELGVALAWQLNPVVNLYTGVTCMMNLFPKVGGLESASLFLPSLPVGVEVSLGLFDLGFEVRWLNPIGSNKNLAIHYIGAGDLGAFGIYLSASMSLGGDK